MAAAAAASRARDTDQCAKKMHNLHLACASILTHTDTQTQASAYSLTCTMEHTVAVA